MTRSLSRSLRFAALVGLLAGGIAYVALDPSLGIAGFFEMLTGITSRLVLACLSALAFAALGFLASLLDDSSASRSQRPLASPIQRAGAAPIGRVSSAPHSGSARSNRYGSTFAMGTGLVTGAAAATAFSPHHDPDFDWDDHSPRFNVDGTPMMGSVDINGNPYGMTSSRSDSSGIGMASFHSGPSVNIDGTPMVGSVDIHGNPYGVTDSDSWSISSPAFDDSWSSGSSFSDDPWSSNFWSGGSSFDD